MHNLYRDMSKSLTQAGWTMELRQEVVKPPQICRDRFVWLPDDVVNFLCSFNRVISPNQNAWFITWLELSGETDSSFSWNQWEQDSLSAAEGDNDWQADIRAFWDGHFPLLLSVKSRYAYAAIRKDSAIVIGEEPEFEEVVKIAGDFSAFLRMLCEDKSSLDRLI